jgi:hypothetical protein
MPRKRNTACKTGRVGTGTNPKKRLKSKSGIRADLAFKNIIFKRQDLTLYLPEYGNTVVKGCGVLENSESENSQNTIIKYRCQVIMECIAVIIYIML